MIFKYPAIAQSWRREWEQVIPFSACAPEVRKILYTTNAIENLNAQVRKAVRVRGHSASEEAATKLVWLVLRKVQARWINPPVFWPKITAIQSYRWARASEVRRSPELRGPNSYGWRNCGLP